MHLTSIISFNSIKTKLPIFIFFLILTVSLYLRFDHIETFKSFGWDQGRDAWAVKDILQGKLLLEGPRTGIGHFHLGPAYYYLLAPWYLLTNLDPIGAIYFNIFAYLFNFLAIFYVFKKIKSTQFGLLAVFIYAFSSGWISASQTVWNVSLVPGVSTIIFYLYYQILRGKTFLLPILAAVWGFFFHLHFTAVFFSIIFLPLIISLPKNKITLKYLLFSVPLFGIWFVPNIITIFFGNQLEAFRIKDFWRDYFIGFHFQFLLHRLPDSLIGFESLITFTGFKFLKYVYPIILIFLALVSNKNNKILTVISVFWLLGPLIGFTLYGGPISDYYFYLTFPAILYIFMHVNLSILNRLPNTIKLSLIIIWGILFFWANTKSYWIKPDEGGLAAQKSEVRETIRMNQNIPYSEGDIRSYLFRVWTEQNLRN